MPRVRLFDWNTADARAKVAALESWGYDVDYEPKLTAGLRDALRERSPAAAIIDLSRAPGTGRDLAIGIRHHKSTRSIPLVFVGGDPGDIARIKEHLPDAVYATWKALPRVLRNAIANPPSAPAAPSLLAGYAHRPLAKKLGIRPGGRVALLGAPRDAERLLRRATEGVTFVRAAHAPRDVTLWFAKDARALDQRLPAMVPVAGRAPLWIAWAKQSSPLWSGLTQAIVRKAGLAAGLVDYKICAIDATWAALLFTRRS